MLSLAFLRALSTVSPKRRRISERILFKRRLWASLRWTQSFYPSPSTPVNGAIDLWPLHGAVFVVRATCQCRKSSKGGEGGACQLSLMEFCFLSYWWRIHPSSHQCVSVCTSALSSHSSGVLCMLLISQTIATYDVMLFRTICQQAPGRRDGRVPVESRRFRNKHTAGGLTRTQSKVNVKGMIRAVYGGFWKKRGNVLNK